MAQYDWLEEIDHTGDCGIRVSAGNLPQLFVRAARAMMQIIAESQDISADEKITFSLEANDRVALLRTWLTRINYYHITHDFLFGNFEVLQISDTKLTGAGFGEAIDADRHQILTEIKAVTYHDLKVEPTDRGWLAQIIFDL